MFHTIKVLVITVGLLFLLQIKIGQGTLEVKAMNWIRTSSLVAPIQNAADGIVKIFSQLWDGDVSATQERIQESYEVGKMNLQKSMKTGKRVIGENYQEMKEKISDSQFFEDNDSADVGQD